MGAGNKSVAEAMAIEGQIVETDKAKPRVP